MIQVIILLSTGGANGGGYEASKYVVIAFHGGILLMHAILNSLPISVLSFFGQLAAAWNIVGMKNFLVFSPFSTLYCLRQPFLHPLMFWCFSGVFVLMILIPLVATERASAKFVFTYFNTDSAEGINSKAYIFVLGLLMSQYTLTGYDASAHMVTRIILLVAFSNKLTAFEICRNVSSLTSQTDVKVVWDWLMVNTGPLWQYEVRESWMMHNFSMVILFCLTLKTEWM